MQPLRFLVDECTGKRLSTLLKKEGYDVLFVGDVIKSASDEEIIKRCEKEKRILITDDKDFGELVFRLGRPTQGVILLRIDVNPQKRYEILSNLFKNYKINKKFIVIKKDSLRIRKLI